MTHKTYAYVRDDIIAQELYPPCSEAINNELWHSHAFEVLEPPCEDFETEEGFNLILRHPIDKRSLFVCSIDFEFKNVNC